MRKHDFTLTKTGSVFSLWLPGYAEAATGQDTRCFRLRPMGRSGSLSLEIFEVFMSDHALRQSWQPVGVIRPKFNEAEIMTRSVNDYAFCSHIAAEYVALGATVIGSVPAMVWENAVAIQTRYARSGAPISFQSRYTEANTDTHRLRAGGGFDRANGSRNPLLDAAEEGRL